MNSKPPKFMPPSPFTPFLRRFTDERARDLAETIALYKEVRAAHSASIWSKEDAAEQVSNFVADWVARVVDLPLSVGFARALDKCQREVLALETTIFSFPEIDWRRASLSLKEQVDLRRFLRAQQHFLSNDERVSDLLTTALGNVFGGLVTELPTLAESSDQSITVPLITLLADPGGTVARVVGTFCTEELAEAGLFTTLQQQFYENACHASGVLPEEELRKPLITADVSELAPVDLIETYLRDTPFADLLLYPVPFTIPEAVRFEHTHIIGGAGWGKSTLIAQTVLADLQQPKPPAIIIIDPHGTLIDEIEHLAIFDPTDPESLARKLVIVDPRDSASPPALNMFDAASKRSKLYSDDVRHEVENNTISLYQYIFGSIASALTQKQATAFSFVVRLLFSIPNATINTLLELMEDGAKRMEDSPFHAHIERLESVTARRFFEHHFFHPTEFRETRQQIAHRLYGLLQNADFERMFVTPERKLDMFECMQSGNIVLVHAARGRLGKEASQLFGRYIIALTFAAAFERLSVPQSQWNPAYLIVDEAADFFDEQIETMLDSVRKFRLGLTFAHQRIEGQVSEAMRSALSANTSIKYAGGVGARDAAFMAKDMFCGPEFIMRQRKTQTATNFACYVRGYTDRAVSLSVPLGLLGRQPKMSETAHRLLRSANAQRLRSTPIPDPDPPRPRSVPVPPTTPIPSPPKSAPLEPEPLESPVAPQSQPTAIDPDAGAHTEAAPKWGE